MSFASFWKDSPATVTARHPNELDLRRIARAIQLGSSFGARGAIRDGITHITAWHRPSSIAAALVSPTTPCLAAM